MPESFSSFTLSTGIEETPYTCTGDLDEFLLKKAINNQYNKLLLMKTCQSYIKLKPGESDTGSVSELDSREFFNSFAENKTVNTRHRSNISDIYRDLRLIKLSKKRGLSSINLQVHDKAVVIDFNAPNNKVNLDVNKNGTAQLERQVSLNISAPFNPSQDALRPIRPNCLENVPRHIIRPNLRPEFNGNEFVGLQLRGVRPVTCNKPTSTQNNNHTYLRTQGMRIRTPQSSKFDTFIQDRKSQYFDNNYYNYLKRMTHSEYKKNYFIPTCLNEVIINDITANHLIQSYLNREKVDNFETEFQKKNLTHSSLPQCIKCKKLSSPIWRIFEDIKKMKYQLCLKCSFKVETREKKQYALISKIPVQYTPTNLEKNQISVRDSMPPAQPISKDSYTVNNRNSIVDQRRFPTNINTPRMTLPELSLTVNPELFVPKTMPPVRSIRDDSLNSDPLLK